MAISMISFVLLAQGLNADSNTVYGLKTNRSFWHIDMHCFFSIQVLPIAQCTLTTYFWSSDTTKAPSSDYIPLTLSFGVDVAILYGHMHVIPKFIYETNATDQGDYPFWGIGGAVALEIHPFKNVKYDPYVYFNLGFLNMAQEDYQGYGYHVDLGGGFVLPINPTVKISPFFAYTLVSQWVQKKEIGYSIIIPGPVYNGRECKCSGLRVGLTFLFDILKER